MKKKKKVVDKTKSIVSKITKKSDADVGGEITYMFVGITDYVASENHGEVVGIARGVTPEDALYVLVRDTGTAISDKLADYIELHAYTLLEEDPQLIDMDEYMLDSSDIPVEYEEEKDDKEDDTDE